MKKRSHAGNRWSRRAGLALIAAGLLAVSALAGGSAGSVAAATAPSINPIPLNSPLEGDTSTAQARFEFRLSAPSSQPVSVNYTTEDGTADAFSCVTLFGQTSCFGDYLKKQGTLTFAPGVTSLFVNVDVRGDNVDEDNETFSMYLSNPVNATILRTRVVTGIVDNDAQPSIYIDQGNGAEGTGSPGGKITFRVRLSHPSQRGLSVGYTTNPGAATEAYYAGDHWVGDYFDATGRLSFTALETQKTITVNLLPDAVREADETFRVYLSNPVNGTIATPWAWGHINDDD
jgi:large repetitive protein